MFKQSESLLDQVMYVGLLLSIWWKINIIYRWCKKIKITLHEAPTGIG